MTSNETTLAVGDILIFKGVAIHVAQIKNQQTRLRVVSSDGKAPWFTPHLVGKSRATVLTFRESVG